MFVSDFFPKSKKVWLRDYDHWLDVSRRNTSIYVQSMRIEKPVLIPANIWFVACLFSMPSASEDNQEMHIYCPNDPKEGVDISITECNTPLEDPLPICLRVNHAHKLTVVDSTVYIERSYISTLDILGRGLVIEGGNTTIRRVGLDTTAKLITHADLQRKKKANCNSL